MSNRSPLGYRQANVVQCARDAVIERRVMRSGRPLWIDLRLSLIGHSHFARVLMGLGKAYVQAATTLVPELQIDGCDS